ncbi:unnamed protein product [Lampetra planeri]
MLIASWVAARRGGAVLAERRFSSPARVTWSSLPLRTRGAQTLPISSGHTLALRGTRGTVTPAIRASESTIEQRCAERTGVVSVAVGRPIRTRLGPCRAVPLTYHHAPPLALLGPEPDAGVLCSQQQITVWLRLGKQPVAWPRCTGGKAVVVGPPWLRRTTGTEEGGRQEQRGARVPGHGRGAASATADGKEPPGRHAAGMAQRR